MGFKRLFIVLIIAFPSLTYSQLKWAPPGSIWYYSSIESLGPSRIGYLVVETIGDTIVQDIEMSILRFTRFTTQGSMEVESRELTFEKDSIVYIWKWDQPNVLYDFTKKPGEHHTIIGHGINFCGEDSLGSIVIDSIGTEEINGIESHYYYSTPTDTSKWQLRWKTNSRYGNQLFMFASPYCDIEDMPFYAGPLRCYFDNEVGWVHIFGVTCDSLIIVNVTPTKMFEDFNIFPNPSNKNIIVESIYCSDENPRFYKIVDSEGRELGSGILNSNRTFLSTDDVPAGIFLLQITKPNSDYNQVIKLLKIPQ